MEINIIDNSIVDAEHNILNFLVFCAIIFFTYSSKNIKSKVSNKVVLLQYSKHLAYRKKRKSMR